MGTSIGRKDLVLNRQNSEVSGFSLAKGKELKGDDYFSTQKMDNLTIAIVCDGVGSALAGAEAASRVTAYLMNSFQNRPKSWSIQKSIQTFVTSINTILYKESMLQYECPELVTTLAMVIIEGERLYGVNVGDSRVYILRDALLTQLSYDHVVDEEGYEGVLTDAIGIDAALNPYYFENIIQPKDKILLCSDGLYTVLDDKALEESIMYGSHALVRKASKLFKDNLPDDTTAVTVDILEINPIVKIREQNLKIIETLKVGMNIDGYVLEKSLIQNNRTWLCLKDEKKYVLKFTAFEALENPDIFDLFVKEAWNAKRLSADFLPEAHIPVQRSHRYYVMEFIDGVDLKYYLQTNKLSVEESIELIKMLLEMGQYLLKYDLVHGDIKPENIMILEKEGKKSFKVIDFGAMTEVYSIDSNAGTPSYLAPERFIGESISESTELFSMGVTLYESLSQNFPYGEIEPFHTPIFKEVNALTKYNKNIPLWLSSIIFRAIDKESQRRYGHYSEMLFELKNPLKVKPYFSKETTLLERHPVMVYRSLFTVSFVVNLILLVLVFD